MKRFFWLLATIFIVSCSVDNEKIVLYDVYGVIKEDTDTSGKLYVKSDEGKAIIPSLSNLLSNDDRGSRVWMLFSTNDDINLDTIKADVYNILKIAQMDVKSGNDESISDNVSLQKIWVAQDYLTLIMEVTAGSESSLNNHSYTICFDTEEIVGDTVHMEFKYNRNNDATSAQFAKVVTLKLDDKINISSSESVILAIKYKTNTGFKETFELYKK
jgi:hypothetical protein